MTLDLLGGHVGDGAEHVTGTGDAFLAGEQRASEVGQLGHAGRPRRGVRERHEHVVGLQVAVDHPTLVGVQEGVGERNADLQDLLVAERLRGEQLGEGVAVDELGDQVEDVVLDARLVQSDDRGVSEARGRKRLAGCALAVLAVLLGGQGDHLDGDLAVEQPVVRAPHHSEAPRSEALQQPVAAEHGVAHRRPSTRCSPTLEGSPCATGPSPRAGGLPSSRVSGESTASCVRRSRAPSLPRRGRRTRGEREVAEVTRRDLAPARAAGPAVILVLPQRRVPKERTACRSSTRMMGVPTHPRRGQPRRAPVVGRPPGARGHASHNAQPVRWGRPITTR